MFHRSSLLIVTLWSAVALSAQPGTRDHRFRSNQELDALTVKLVHQAINDLDPNGRVAIDGSLLKARLNSEVSSSDLLSALNSIGAYTFIQGWPVARLDRETPGPADPPIYQDTGNPTLDSIVFATAKQAWIDSNPPLSVPSTSTPTPTK